MNSNNFIIFIIYFSLYASSCYNKKKDTYSNNFNIDSITIISNTCCKDSLIFYNNLNYCLLHINCKITNKTTNALHIIRPKDLNVITCKGKYFQIKNDTITLNYFPCDEIIEFSIDTIDSFDSDNYVYYARMNTKFGYILYTEANIKLYDSILYKSQFDRHGNFSDSIYQKIEKINSNKFLFRVNLFENNVYLVDSTIEEVLESYKRRGYIVQ